MAYTLRQERVILGVSILVRRRHGTFVDVLLNLRTLRKRYAAGAVNILSVVTSASSARRFQRKRQI